MSCKIKAGFVRLIKKIFHFENTHISFSRPFTDYSKVNLLYGFLIRNKRFQLLNPHLNHKNYLNLGCGENINKDFINLDIRLRRGIDLCWDVRRNIPLPNESMQGIYTEHLLEHLSPEQGRKVLHECSRILKDKGTLRIVVPNLELYIEIYYRHKMGEHSPFPYENGKNWKTPAMGINSIFYDYGHKFLYDSETLELVLKEAQFSDIRKESFRHGRDPRLLIDTEYRLCESLYIEASILKS